MRIFNKKARFNYIIIETLEAGVVLSGFEVKSIRMGRVDLSDSFARIENNEAVLKNMYIHPFQNPPQGYIPNKDRKLLLHRKQINSLLGRLQTGINLIPLSLYTKKSLVKVELGLGASKKKFDKRRAIKERDQVRKLEQELGS
jgi:SsrA-binding protein